MNCSKRSVMEWNVNKLCIYTILAINQSFSFDRPQYRQNSSSINAILQKIVQWLYSSYWFNTNCYKHIQKHLKQPLLVQHPLRGHISIQHQSVTCRQVKNSFKTNNKLRNMLCKVCSTPDILQQMKSSTNTLHQ